MITPRRDFGTRIEEIVTHIGDEICRVNDHELHDIRIGRISDESKLTMLKQELYVAARNGRDSEYIRNLQRAIETISNQLEADRNHRNSPVEQIYGILNSSILLAFLAATLSFPSAWGCNLVKSNSQFCQVSRVLPTATFKFFSNPK